MNRETIKKANEILRNIERHEKTIEILETFGNLEKYRLHYDTPEEKFDVFLEPEEITTIIENKKIKIAKLEKELEVL